MWKVISDTDGLYFASDDGRIKSADRERSYVSHSTIKGTYIRKGKILKQPLNCYGYPCVTLKYRDGSQKVVQVHRLVAETFIPNPNNLPQVNHIDGNKQNNNIDNLEWCSVRDNLLHAFKTGLNKGSHHMIGKCGKLHHNSIPVIAFKPDGSVFMEFESCNLAAKYLGLNCASHISSCIKGKRKTAGGYFWKIKNDQTSNVETD